MANRKTNYKPDYYSSMCGNHETFGFDDIAGNCGVAYFMHQWNLLKYKYQK